MPDIPRRKGRISFCGPQIFALKRRLFSTTAEIFSVFSFATSQKESAEKQSTKTVQKPAKPGKSSSKEGALSGVFTINKKGDKICFSQGALQFNPAKYEFRFAKNQYEAIVKDNEMIAPGLNGWIDLFGWGTSGYMGCQPTEFSEKSSEYGPSSGDVAGTNYDWGLYNPITNGGNKEGVWRTPTSSEWAYLQTDRPNANIL